MEDSKEFKHESYGMVGISRCTGYSGRLFGSSVNTHTFMMLRIKPGVRVHSLSRDWFRGATMEPLIEIKLSPAQFAELLTTMNVGDGVPCTITAFNSKEIKQAPEELSVTEQIRHDFKDRMRNFSKKVVGMKDELSALVDKKSLTIKDKSEFKQTINMLVQEIESNVPFILKSFNEAAVKTVTEAKAEVDAFVTHAIIQTGIAQIASNRLNDQALKELPEHTDEDIAVCADHE